MSGRTIYIDPLSLPCLRVWAQVQGKQVSTASAFVVKLADRPYLITNWHVVTGVDPNNNERVFPEPTQLLVHHHAQSRLGVWVDRVEPLQASGGKPRWIEHAKGKSVDVVALPLQVLDSTALYPLDLSLADADVVPEPAMPVSIIGYPWGLWVDGGWPVWKTGHIASDPDLDYNSLPSFLVDVTARAGMSGSPVVLRLSGGYRLRNGSRVMSVSHPVTLFLGVYSAQFTREELGIVWKPQVIREILALAPS